MAIDFRHLAREALARARTEMAPNDSQRLRYAALELRTAIEALTYDRAQAFKDDFPPSEYATWQPKKVLMALLEMAPGANSGGTITVGQQTAPGVPCESLTAIGSESVFDLKAIKDNYDALGSYLHMPSLKQVQNGKLPDLSRLRERCLEVAARIEEALASPVFNVTIGKFATLDCVRCKARIRKRLRAGNDSTDATCFECGAQYRVQALQDGRTQWTQIAADVVCPNIQCGSVETIAADQLFFDARWKCQKCQTTYRIVYGLAAVDPVS